MLVLSRKVGEKICIGGGIEVTIVKVRGDRVQVGINAPPEVAIHRQEIAARMEHEAAQSLPMKPRWTERDFSLTH